MRKCKKKFEVLTAILMKIRVFHDVIPCRVANKTLD